MQQEHLLPLCYLSYLCNSNTCRGPDAPNKHNTTLEASRQQNLPDRRRVPWPQDLLAISVAQEASSEQSSCPGPGHKRSLSGVRPQDL